MNDDVLITLLGALTGLLSAVVTSFIIPVVQKRQEKAEQRRSIYERYAQPLAADAVNLLWRLDEILVRQRGQYLDESAPPTPFNQYKLTSTCFRIATLLGWIRAIKLEQSHLLYGEDTSLDNLRAAVVAFESALADGPHVEVHILEGLAALWEVTLPPDRSLREKLAAQVVAELQHGLSVYGLTRYQELPNLAHARQIEVARRVAGSMSAMLGLPPVPEPVLGRSCGEAMGIAAVKQAWLYRDWQQAIGDVMIREIDGASRRYDVIGYGAFEALFAEAGNPWIERLRSVVVGVDPANPLPGDFRLAQLRNVARAVARVVCAIENLDVGRKILDPQACELGRSLAELPATGASR